MAYDNRFEIHAGEAYNSIAVIVRDASNEIPDLTSHTGWWHAKKFPPS